MTHNGDAMIFARLANAVVKRHVIIIVIWLLILSCSLPFVFGMGDVIAYQETEFVDESYESQQAAAVINEQFPSDSANSSMVLVLLRDDLTTPENRDMVLQLEADIKADADLKYLESTTSIYDIYEMALEKTIGLLAPNMTLAEEEVNLSLQMLFGMPDGYAMSYELIVANSAMFMQIPYGYSSSFEGVNQTSGLVYGIPSQYLLSWFAASYNNSNAYNWTKANVSAMASMMDPQNASFLSNYYATFTFFWNTSSTIDPQQRLAESIDSAVQSMIPSLPLEFKMILWAVNGNLTLTNFFNPFNQSDVAFRMMNDSFAPFMTDQMNTSLISGMLSITDGYWRGSLITSPGLNASQRIASILPSIDLAFKLMVSDLTEGIILANFGTFMTDPMAVAFAQPILNITHDMWNASISSSPMMATQSRLQALLPPMQENFTAVMQASGMLPAEQLSLLSELTVAGGNFGLSNYTNASVQHSFMLDMISEQSEITNMTFLQEVYELGANASEANVTSLAWKVVREGTIGNYPIDLPAGVARSLVSEDEDSMLVMVSFTKSSGFREADDSKPVEENVAVVRGVARDAEAANPNLTIYVTGEVPLNTDMSSMADKDLQLIEPITISLVLILMGLFFRSVLGPVIPLASIGVALGISQAAVFFIGTYVANVHFTVQTMLIAILFGVGTDYSIFILARYREELLKGANRDDAMRTSLTWAGESIATSGTTVIISFAAISLSSFSMLTTMGLVLSVAVLIALLIALTLVPSVALVLKGKIFWPISGERWERFKQKYSIKRTERRGGYFRKAAKFAVRHAVPIFIAAILISIPATYLFLTGATSFDFINGMGQTESVEGLNAMSDTFGAGRISPTQIVITFNQSVILSDGNFSISMLNTMENISKSILSENANVREINGPSRPNGDYVNYTNLSSLPLSEQISLEMQMKSFVGEDNKTVLINAIYTEEPLTHLSMDTTRAIREQLAESSDDPNLAGAEILVGGESAALVDVDKVTSREFTQMEIFVIIGVFIVLLVVLGSVILPLFAILSIGLSISWTLAATILVFDVFLGKPVLWILPIIIFVVLMGLGMDYNIFILTRVREEAHKGKNHERAIIEAVDRTGGIITACAVIMAGAFGSIMISNTTMLEEFGFALSFAVLLDAMLVRTYLTPAIMKILGPRWTWFGPKFLQRLDPEEISSEKFEDKEY
jgi:RND superfamily putative drug exporter